MRTILFGFILWAVALASATHQNSESANCVCDNHESWMAYCQAYDVDPENPTVEQSDFYMDCWAGSVEEEKALEKLN